MTSGLSDSARRVQKFLEEMGGSYQVKELSGSTRTAQEAAESVGCDVAQIAKSLVFKERESGEPILVIASGANRVDLKKIRAVTSLTLKRADGNYVKKKTGFAIGGVPPVAHKEHLKTLLDEDLKQHPSIWAAAGTPFALFQLVPGDLESLTGGQWLNLREEA
jgi:prolyl-tRNA editing enzyme YbaK/EbsC (Cys-tRNA(Pro) deacylase)